jgi:hypothetical protein
VVAVVVVESNLVTGCGVEEEKTGQTGAFEETGFILVVKQMPRKDRAQAPSRFHALSLCCLT